MEKFFERRRKRLSAKKGLQKPPRMAAVGKKRQRPPITWRNKPRHYPSVTVDLPGGTRITVSKKHEGSAADHGVRSRIPKRIIGFQPPFDYTLRALLATGKYYVYRGSLLSKAHYDRVSLLSKEILWDPNINDFIKGNSFNKYYSFQNNRFELDKVDKEELREFRIDLTEVEDILKTCKGNERNAIQYILNKYSMQPENNSDSKKTFAEKAIELMEESGIYKDINGVTKFTEQTTLSGNIYSRMHLYPKEYRPKERIAYTIAVAFCCDMRSAEDLVSRANFSLLSGGIDYEYKEIIVDCISAGIHNITKVNAILRRCGYGERLLGSSSYSKDKAKSK